MTAHQPATSAVPARAPARGRFAASTFDSIYRFEAFRRLWLASLAYTLSQWMQSTALLWLAYDLTDSARSVGLVAFAAGCPFILVSIPGGALLDRFDRRKVLLVSQSIGVVSAIGVATVVLVGAIEPWHLLVGGFVNGSLQAIINPSQQALVPRLVDAEHMQNALGLMSAGANMTRVFGPALAGTLIGFVGVGFVFLLQATAMTVALLIVLRSTFPAATASVSRMSLNVVLSGIGVVRAREDLCALFLLSALSSLLVFPYISFLNVYAQDELGLGSSGFGMLMASSGIGAVVGGLTVATSRRRSGMGMLLLATTAAYCVLIFILMAFSTVVTSVLCLIAAGFLGAYAFSANNATIQQRITDDIRGRVMGTYLLTWGLMPLGALWMGPLAQSIGIRGTTMIGAGLCTLLIGVVALRTPSLRTF